MKRLLILSFFSFIIRTENQDGSSVCSRRLGKKFVLEKKIASGTTLGQRAQVSMLGRTSDAASNINLVKKSTTVYHSVTYHQLAFYSPIKKPLSMIKAPLSRLFTAVSGTPLKQETVSAFAGLQSAMEALPRAHELAQWWNFRACCRLNRTMNADFPGP